MIYRKENNKKKWIASFELKCRKKSIYFLALDYIFCAIACIRAHEWPYSLPSLCFLHLRCLTIIWLWFDKQMARLFLYKQFLSLSLFITLSSSFRTQFSSCVKEKKYGEKASAKKLRLCILYLQAYCHTKVRCTCAYVVCYLIKKNPRLILIIPIIKYACVYFSHLVLDALPRKPGLRCE